MHLIASSLPTSQLNTMRNVDFDTYLVKFMEKIQTRSDIQVNKDKWQFTDNNKEMTAVN